MHIHELFRTDHVRLRRQISELQAAVAGRSDQLETLYTTFQKDMREHFRKEDEVYYPYVDGGKKIADRDLMHTLRNDHAAVVFSLESLAIRLRRKVPLEEWKVKFESMIHVLLPHLDHEEKSLFPEVEKTVPADALQTLLEKVQALE